MERRNARATSTPRTSGRVLAAALTWVVLMLAARPAGAAPTVVDLGPLVGPEHVLRDGGQSVRLGNRLLWLYGDTLYPGCDPVCASNSAGLGRAKGPTEELGAEFIPLTAAERAAWQAGDDRIVVWPEGAIRTGATTAAVFFARYHVTGPLSYEPLGWGVATVTGGDHTATRVLEMGGQPYGHPMRSGGFVYAYGCARSGWMEFSCKVARAPLAELSRPTSWRFWDGGAWSTDPADAVFSLTGPSGGLSVSWNRYLGRYLATYNLALTNRVVIRTAPSPTGPWSAPATLFTGLEPPAGMLDYAAYEHPELARDHGRVLTVTYYHPLGPWQGEVRRVSVTLAAT